MTCFNCNFQNKADARFCAECGASFVPATASNPVVQPPPTDVINPTVQSSSTATYNTAPTSPASFDASNIKIPLRFFTFLKPYLNYIDKGSIFRRPFFWLYIIFSILCLIVPLYFLLQIIDKDLAKYTNTLLAILVWLLVAFTFWLGFQMWWDRKDKIQSVTRQGDEFVALPVFSYFIQHFGEWLSLTIALLGVGGSLLALLFSDSFRGFYYFIDVRREAAGYLWKAPLLAFAVLILTRVIAEILRALTSIANNTKKL